MMKSNKQFPITYFLLILLLSFSYLFPHSAKAALKNLNRTLILVPGTGASDNRFDDLFDQLGVSESDVLKITVAENSKLETSGSYNSAVPIIVIAFENPGEYNLSQQGQWYAAALRYASSTYHFTTYDYYGHSNGGLVAVDYLENQFKSTDPDMIHLTTVGTPYNDIYETADTDIATLTETQRLTSSKTSSIFKKYYAARENLPNQLKVTILYGENDGIVSTNTAKAGAFIFGGRLTAITEITDGATAHSALVTNTTAVQTFLSSLYGHNPQQVAAQRRQKTSTLAPIGASVTGLYS